ncbi:hypothetical protein HJFPF1_05071 [Paramyrothecium foliicola]|nr:hypothetical protein HJFPF1_05071 [Paramyrothecium foliicola]
MTTPENDGLSMQQRAKARTPLSRHEIAYFLRKELEDSLWIHFLRLTHFVPRYSFEIDKSSGNDKCDTETIDQSYDFCNKTVPIYICDPARPASVPPPERPSTKGFATSLLTWLHGKWLKPYRSEIEWGRFIAKIIRLRGSWSDGGLLGFSERPEELIDRLIALHASACEHVETDRREVLERSHRSDLWVSKTVEKLCATFDLSAYKREQPNYLLQHIFKAVIILVDNQQYSPETRDIGETPAYIVLTGVEDGLSAPITFDLIEQSIDTTVTGSDGKRKAVRTTLNVVYTFVTMLEEREAAAFGLRPDPVQVAEALGPGYQHIAYRVDFMQVAAQYGWQKDWEPLAGPSSAWTDAAVPAPEWIASCPSRHDEWENRVARTTLLHKDGGSRGLPKDNDKPPQNGGE